MSKNIAITLIFIFLTLLVLVGFWYFSSNSPVPIEEEYSDFPNIELTDIKTVNDFRNVVQSESQQSEAVMDALYTDEYYYYSCKESDLESRVLILVAKYTSENGINTFNPAVDTFSSFETRLLQDWGEVLLPSSTVATQDALTFSTRALNNEYILATEYRVAETSDKKYKVFYGWLLNYIVIATDQECLFKALEDLYHIH